jgi:peptidoglycan/xylan/chitin deacetylase (PgdA/CDA1 family)
MLSSASSTHPHHWGHTRLKIEPIVLPLMALAASVSLAGSVPAPYEIGTWQGFRPAAISYTFDDSCANQFAVAIPMFDQKGFKLTLFSCTGTMFAGWPNLQNAAAKGHEIASHTVTHANLSGLSDAQQITELQNSRDAINANVTTQKCVTLAYPYCAAGKESLTSQCYIAARTCSGQVVPSTPANFMQISSYICGSLGSVQTLQNFTNTANTAAAVRGWCVYLIHGIDSDGGYSPLPSATLQASIDYFSANQDRFWVDTFGDVARYTRERDAASVTETSSQDDRITLQVTDGLDDSSFNHPITLRRPLPANWPGAAVSQNNRPAGARIVNVGSTNFVMFDVVPDGGEVILSKLTSPTLGNPVLEPATGFTFRLEGQAGVRYAIHSSGDLVNWSSVQTNTLVSPHTNFTVAAPDSLQFYRAQWVP